MKKNAFKDYICRPYCVFFKDGEKEEMACRGAVIAGRLVQSQRISLQPVEQEHEKKDTRFKNDDAIIRMVCASCPFEAEDCDFRSSSPPKNSVPCGGYILLYILKSKGLITVKDLMEICNENG